MKTDRFISLIMYISRSQRKMITDAKFRELLGQPSKSQYYVYRKELTNETIERPAVLSTVEVDGEVFFKLHDQNWAAFYQAQEEGAFLLECHRKLGYLLESGIADIDFSLSKSKRKEVNRKFVYLSAVKGHQFNDEQKIFINDIINALLQNQKIAILYKTKSYELFPLSLCQYRDELYLLAHKNKQKKENIRFFKIQRIEALNLLDAKYKYPKIMDWNPEEYFKNTSGLVVGQEESATIHVYGNARKLIQEKDFFSNSLNESFDEFDQYNVTYTNVHEFLGQVFVYADEIEIIAPEKLRQQFLKKADTAIKLNTSKVKAS